MRVTMINPDTASDEVKEAIEAHLKDGHRLTNEKLTLLHSVPSFQAIEVGSYAVDRELASLIGKRAADIFEYAISDENECMVCSVYFRKLLKSEGIDIEHFELTEEESLLVEYGRALAKEGKHISKDLKDRMQAVFDEKTFVVITSMGLMMLANNLFNEIMEVEPETMD